MARDKALLMKRNKQIHARFETLCRTRPHWKVEYIINKIADAFCLSPRTVENILKIDIKDKKEN